MDFKEANEIISRRIDEEHNKGDEASRVFWAQMKHDDIVSGRTLLAFGIFVSAIVLGGVGYIIYGLVTG